MLDYYLRNPISKAVNKAGITLSECHIRGTGGTVLPGKIAEEICPDILHTVSSGVKTVMVCGTDGKTTTVRYLTALLEAAGIICFSNREGEASRDGILTAFVLNADLKGVPYAKTAVIACEERYFTQMTEEIRPEVLVLLPFTEVSLGTEEAITAYAKRSGAAICAAEECEICSRIAAHLKKSNRIISYSAALQGGRADGRNYKFSLQLPALCNYQDASAALAGAAALGYDPEPLLTALCKCILPPGRFERVYDENREIILTAADHTASQRAALSYYNSLPGKYEYISGEKPVQELISEISESRSPVFVMAGYERTMELRRYYSEKGCIQPFWEDPLPDVKNPYGYACIEVDLDNQRLKIFSDEKLIMESRIVSGTDTETSCTPTGVTHVYEKGRERCLQQWKFRSGFYVNYWIAFAATIWGCGFHDQTWSRVEADFRNPKTYKTDGTDGCVHLPLDKMKQLYELSYPGMPVIIPGDDITLTEEQYGWKSADFTGDENGLFTAMAAMLRSYNIEEYKYPPQFSPRKLMEKMLNEGASGDDPLCCARILEKLYPVRYTGEKVLTEEELSAAVEKGSLCLVKIISPEGKEHYLMADATAPDGCVLVIDPQSDNRRLNECGSISSVMMWEKVKIST